MKPQTNYIVFLCYGTAGTLEECAFSLLTLSRLYTPAALAQTEIWIYTDNAAFFQSFRECNLPLHFRHIDANTIKQWRGSIDFTHRVKIELLKDFTQTRQGNVLYLDSDTVFINRIGKMLEQIQAGKLYMHVMEGRVSDKQNPVLTKLDNYLRKSSTRKVKGQPIHELAMWNAGVLGFNTRYKHLLDEVLKFTDTEYPKFPKHIVEQFAFSVSFQEQDDVKSAAQSILHYWNLKELRPLLYSFFDHFRDKSWDELTQLSQLIQIHVLIQEKANFYRNRSIAGAIQKKQWQPELRNWEELCKQL